MSTAATPLDFRNTNALWGSVFAETLVRLGVRQAVISPGSRSTPLTMALARHGGIEAIPVLDERSAAFFALGLARAQGKPVVLLCTSGTAGANYFPAVIEAQESGVPLLVVTADRPPELRDCGSGQTIDQQKLFGAHVNFYHELAVPEATVAMLGYLRQTVAHACERTLRPVAGPVHLNAPFRDPLPPVADESARKLEPLLTAEFFAHLDAMTPVMTQSTIWQRPTTARGVIVAGPAMTDDPAGYAAKVRALSAALGWPVLADVLSPVRHHAQPGDGIVAGYDTILRNAALAKELTPRTVLCLGGWPTSKVLRAWLEGAGAEILLVAPGAANRDALHGRTRQITAPVESLAVAGGRARDTTYLRRWSELEAATGRALAAAVEGGAAMFEGRVTGVLARSLPTGTPVFVASSMPVRDAEYFWPVTGRGTRFHFNRGANGIDGTLSTAVGVAHGIGRPAVLLTGDLALLHDANGFLLHAKLRGSLTVVLINNNGGGIFEHLPVAEFDPPFETFFATPQDVDFAKLCAAHGVAHTVVQTMAQLAELMANLPVKGLRVLEVRTDRKADAATRKRLFRDVAAGLR